MFSKKGFTLIELAIVLVIFGLLLVSGIGIVSILVKNQKFNESKAVVNKACKSIEGYAISHKKLPSDLNSLGVPTKDPYTNDLVYAFATNMDTFDFCNNEPSNWLTLDDKGVSKNIAFIVYSKGANMHDETNTGTNTYQIKPYGTEVGSYKYDDVVCFGDINLLREKGCQAFEIVTNSLPEGTQYLPYPTVNFQISGGTLNNCSQSGSLPNGITFDSATCSISGTPTQAGTFNFSITTTDTIGRTTSKSFNLTVNPNPVKITTPYLPYAYLNQDYSAGLTADGGDGNYTWSIVSNGGLSSMIINSDGVISIDGSDLSSEGTKVIGIKVCDTNFSSACDTKTYTLTILSSSSGSGSGSGGSSGGGGGSGSSYFYILNKDKIGYEINSGTCVKLDKDSALILDLNSYDINNDSLTFYKEDNCTNDHCTYTINDLINIDSNNNNLIKLDKVDKNNKCIFVDL